jgi:hypothetical protein
MEELRGSVKGMSLDTSSSLMSFATELIGCEDALSWYRNHESLFHHPRFTADIVPFWNDCR